MRHYVVRVHIGGESAEFTYGADTPLHKAVRYLGVLRRVSITEDDLRRAARGAKKASAKVRWRKVALAVAAWSTGDDATSKVTRRRSQ
jgi:hypothetical protein